jgi:arylsulfatase A-like enzyme
MRQTEQDWFSAQVFRNAGDWLSKNHNHHSFFLHIDCFDPHEPWDPPDEFVKLFHPNGYDVAKEPSTPPYGQWQLHMTEESMNLLRAKYAAHVMLLDRSLGVFLDKMDELDLWKNTVVMFVSDHGTYNGDHGRMGKLQTHEHDAVGHIPFIIAHPLLGRGQRRNQLVQLVDIYPTVLKLLERPVPDNIHGVDLLPVLEDGRKETRQYAIAGQFGKSMTITDSEWIMHKSPVDGNSPLFWYGHCLSRFQKYELGEYREGRREVYQCDSWNAPTWLSDKKTDINELMNLAEKNPKKVSEMKEALKKTLLSLNAPEEQILRLGL